MPRQTGIALVNQKASTKQIPKRCAWRALIIMQWKRVRGSRAWNVILSLKAVNKVPGSCLLLNAQRRAVARSGNGVSMTQRYQIMWRDAKWDDVTCYARVLRCRFTEGETQGSRFTADGTAFLSVPVEVAGSSFAFTVGFRLSRLRSWIGERQVRGRGYYPVMYCLFRGKKKKTTRGFPSFSYVKETTVREDKCARFRGSSTSRKS